MNNDLKSLKTLQNVNLSHIENNPKFGSFQVTVKRFYTDVDGTILDKNDPAIPLFMKRPYPAPLFGDFDRDGGYNILSKILPVLDVQYFFNGIYTNYFDLLTFSGANNIIDQLKIGDFLMIYADDKKFPNIFCWIVISSYPRAYASILQNPLSVGMHVKTFKIFSDNFNQYNEVFFMPVINEIGDYKHDQFSPLQFLTPDYQENNFIRVDLDFKITNWTALYFWFDFATNVINFEFRYLKP